VPVRRGRPHRPGSVGSGKSGRTSRPAGSRTWCAGRSRSAAGTGTWPPACGIFAGTWSEWDTTGTASGASRLEAGCRTFGPRLKRPGTRWSQRGDSAMLPPKGCVMDLRLPDPLDWRAIQALAARPKNLGYTLDTLRADQVTVRCVSLRVPGPRSRRRPCGDAARTGSPRGSSGRGRNLCHSSGNSSRRSGCRAVGRMERPWQSACMFRRWGNYASRNPGRDAVHMTEGLGA